VEIPGMIDSMGITSLWKRVRQTIDLILPCSLLLLRSRPYSSSCQDLSEDGIQVIARKS
jgi:hypothetical protein